MRELLNEVMWRSGRSTGEPTKRQEGMMAMQALLGKLTRESKRKVTKAEVSTKAEPAPTQVVIIGGGGMQAMVFFRFTQPESLVIVAEAGTKVETFKGSPSQAQQLGTEAGTWLRKALSTAKRSKRKPRREGMEMTMLEKLLGEMREQAGLPVNEDDELLQEARPFNGIQRMLGQVGPNIQRLAKFANTKPIKELSDEELRFLFTAVRMLERISDRVAGMVQEVGGGARGSFDPSKMDYLKKVAKDAGFGGTL